MKLGYWLLGSLLLCSGWVSAQEHVTDTLEDTTVLEDGGRHHLTIHGNLDFYYKSTFHGNKTPTTSFTDANERFELGMMSVQLAYQDKNYGVVLDLGFGPRARAFAYTDQGAMAAIKQAYIYYDVTKGLRISAGTWATHIGYELLDPALNANYSMSYLFSTGPFSNTGVKAEYITGNHHFMAGISNPTDYRSVPENVLNRKTIIARYSYEKPSGLVMALNYSGGKQVDSVNLQQIDAVVSVPISNRLSLGWNGSVVLRKKMTTGTMENADKSWQNWWGQALYLKADLCKRVQLGLREEYFNDKKGISVIPLLGNVWSTTATAQIKQGDFTLMPEIRWDRFSAPYGAGGSTNAQNASRGQLYGLIAVAYQF